MPRAPPHRPARAGAGTWRSMRRCSPTRPKRTGHACGSTSGSEPTLSLGYFQATHGERAARGQSTTAPSFVARRRRGHRARPRADVLHDAAGRSPTGRGRIRTLYAAVHDAFSQDTIVLKDAARVGLCTNGTRSRSSWQRTSRSCAPSDEPFQWTCCSDPRAMLMIRFIPGRQRLGRKMLAAPRAATEGPCCSMAACCWNSRPPHPNFPV